MTEATGHEAKTIHRLLEYSFQKGGFQKNETTPLDCDLLIVDEASMIDILLMHHLLKAVPARATFVMVGDVNQLPSVGAGNVLRDIIESRAVPVVELTEIFRQARESSIIVNAHLINQGRMPNLKSSSEKLDDFYFIEQEDPEKVLELIVTLVKERIPKRFGFDPIDDIQVLTPMHRGIVGGSNLNVELQKALNPGEEGSAGWGGSIRRGDKVMQIANNYDEGGLQRGHRPDHRDRRGGATGDGHDRRAGGTLRLFGAGRARPRLRRLDPQIPGFRVPGGGDPDPHPALHPPPAEPPVHRGHSGKKLVVYRRDEESDGNRHQEQQDREALHSLGRAGERVEWDIMRPW